jgi:hypothetical protein
VSGREGGVGGSSSEAVAPRSGGEPLLVTGMPRTATSWVGKMLEASGALVYVNEPLNPPAPAGPLARVLRAEVEHAFQYISEENERVWLPAFQDTVRLRFHPLAELRRNHRPYDVARAVKYAAGFALGRLRGRRALLDDPYAVFAAPWLAQPALVRDRLGRFAPELEAALADAADGVGQAGLLWRVIYGAVAGYRAEIPDLEVVRHEGLSADPVPAFAALYGRLGLPFGPAAERVIVAATSAGSGGGAMRWSVTARGVSKTAARRLDAGPTSRCGASASAPRRWPASPRRPPTWPRSSGTPRLDGPRCAPAPGAGPARPPPAWSGRPA